MDEPGRNKNAAKKLTARIEKELEMITINAPDWWVAAHFGSSFSESLMIKNSGKHCTVHVLRAICYGKTTSPSIWMTMLPSLRRT